MPMHLSSKVFILLSKFGICISKRTNPDHAEKLLGIIRSPRRIPLFRAGGRGDGGYWLPQDLDGIRYCFSPGVATNSSFEEDLVSRDMQIFLADKSVDNPPIQNEKFHFIKKHLASYSDNCESLISLDDWCAESIPSSESESELLLQMDIEGCEYEVIHSISQKLLKRFKVLVIEFHNLHQLLNCNQFEMMERAFLKILKDFDVVHFEENRFAGYFEVSGKSYSRLLEVTFIRKLK
jgi:hypothetical protein